MLSGGLGYLAVPVSQQDTQRLRWASIVFGYRPAYLDAAISS
jgi:hypothetical protein